MHQALLIGVPTMLLPKSFLNRSDEVSNPMELRLSDDMTLLIDLLERISLKLFRNCDK